MRRIVNTAFAYMLIGVASGLFYRELTKMQDFPEDRFTQLGLAHTHLLTLGFIVLLIVLVLEKVFTLSRSRAFTWFWWTYNAGVVLTSAMLVWHGTLTVLGHESSAMIAGMAGLGHMLLTAGMILLFVALRKAVAPARAEATTAGVEAVEA